MIAEQLFMAFAISDALSPNPRAAAINDAIARSYDGVMTTAATSAEQNLASPIKPHAARRLRTDKSFSITGGTGASNNIRSRVIG